MNYLATEMEYRMNLESKALFKRPGSGKFVQILQKACTEIYISWHSLSAYLHAQVWEH